MRPATAKIQKSLLISIALLGFAGTHAWAKEWSWSKISDPAQRYQKLTNFNNEAVMDKETGLIWEQCPSTLSNTWSAQKNACYFKTTGGRMGWRMPTFEEIASLGDPGATPFLPNSGAFCSTASTPCSPSGGTCNADYWTSSIGPFSSTAPMVISGGGVFTDTIAPNLSRMVWCVRGGQFNQAP